MATRSNDHGSEQSGALTGDSSENTDATNPASEGQDPWAAWESQSADDKAAVVQTSTPQSAKAKAKPATAQEQDDPSAQPAAPAAESRASSPTPATLPASSDAPSAIRKGIYISALIYVEGNMPPADDFIEPARAVVKAAIAKSIEGEHGGLTMTLKSVNVENNVDDADPDTPEPHASSKKKEQRFQF